MGPHSPAPSLSYSHCSTAFCVPAPSQWLMEEGSVSAPAAASARQWWRQAHPRLKGERRARIYAVFVFFYTSGPLPPPLPPSCHTSPQHQLWKTKTKKNIKNPTISLFLKSCTLSLIRMFGNKDICCVRRNILGSRD